MVKSIVFFFLSWNFLRRYSVKNILKRFSPRSKFVRLGCLQWSYGTVALVVSSVGSLICSVMRFCYCISIKLIIEKSKKEKKMLHIENNMVP